MSNIASSYRVLQFFIFASLFLLLPIITLAQERPVTSTEPTVNAGVVMANINISESAILSQTQDGILRVVSTITNNGTETQSDIRIGLDIVKKTDKGQTIVDSMVSGQTLSLAPGESLQQELQYPAQSFLSGEYEVWVIGRTTGGVMLGLGMAGKTTFFSNGAEVEIVPESCTLQVAGDKKTYSLNQGVDVATEEVLSFSCTLENHGSAAVTVIPVFTTYRRSTYGEPVAVATENSPAVTLTANEKKVVSFVIPKATAPQAYDVSLVLKDQSSQAQLSNKVIAHYVLRGASATIQSLSLDKPAYTQGDLLSARLFWTPSADQFPDSRAGDGTTLSTVIVKMAILDGNGVACIEPIEKKIEATDANPLVLQTTTTADCVSPQVSVSLIDGSGKVLDARIFASAIAQVSDFEDMPMSIDDSLDNKMTVLIVVIGLLLLIGLSFIVRDQKIKKVNFPPVETFKTFFFLILLSAGVFMGAGEAQALNFGGGGALLGEGQDAFWYSDPQNYAVNTDKSTYAPGETITLSMGMWLSKPASSGYGGVITATLNGITVSFSGGGDNSTIYATRYLTAPSSPGSYNIALTGCDTGLFGSTLCYSANIPIIVAAAPVNGACNLSAPNSCVAGTLGANSIEPDGSYHWSCNGTNGGADSDLCYYVPPTPPPTSAPVNGACNLSAPNTCIRGTLGVNNPQGNGIYHWYCNGLNGGSNSNLCYYVPSAMPLPVTPPVTPPPTGTYNSQTCDYLTADKASLAPGETTTLHGSCLDATYGNGQSFYSLNNGSLEYFKVPVPYTGRTRPPYPGVPPHLMKDTVIGPFPPSAPYQRTYTLRCRSEASSSGSWFGVGEGTCTKRISVNVPAPTTPITPITPVTPVVPTLPTTPVIPTTPGVPTAPFGLTVTAQACSSGANFLDWADVVNAASYSIYNSATGAWIGNSVGSNYTHVGALSTTYSYFVRANSSTGSQSGNSAIVSGTTAGACAGEPAVSPLIEIILDPDLIRSGNTANVRVGVTSEFNTTCILQGVLGNSITINHIGGTSKVVYTKTTRPLTSAQVVSLTCTIDGFPAFTSSTNARIKVIPINEEI